MKKMFAALMVTLLACMIPVLVHGLLMARDAYQLNLAFRAVV